MAARWSDDEKETLRAIWASPVPVPHQAHRLPQRTVDSIEQMAMKMKLGAKNRAFSPMLLKIRELMRDGQPRCAIEVAKRVGGSVGQVRELMDNEVEAKRFHIQTWKQVGVNGQWQKMFRMGKGRNAEKPAPMTDAERSSRFRANVDPDEFEFKRKKYALNRLIKTGALVRRDPLTAAFFGDAR